MRKWLVELREANGLTQKALAEQAMISQPSMCDIEKGVNNPRPETAKRIAAILNFDWTRFFDK